MFSPEFTRQLEEVNNGTRGFISISRLCKQTGDDAKTLKALASAAGFNVERHGRYGFCITR